MYVILFSYESDGVENEVAEEGPRGLAHDEAYGQQQRCRLLLFGDRRHFGRLKHHQVLFK